MSFDAINATELYDTVTGTDLCATPESWNCLQAGRGVSVSAVERGIGRLQSGRILTQTKFFWAPSPWSRLNEMGLSNDHYKLGLLFADELGCILTHGR